MINYEYHLTISLFEVKKMRRLWALSITLLMVIAISKILPVEDSSAYKFRGDLGNHGFFDSEVPDNYSLLWSFDSGGFSIQSSPVVVDNKVYFGSTNGRLYCINALTGNEIWNFSTRNSVLSTPCIVDDIVYIGSNDRNIYALDVASGSKLWNYTFARLSAQISSSISVANDLLFVGTDDSYFYALDISDPQSPQLEWEFQTGGWIQSSPAIDWPYVYFGSLDGKIYCLWTENGTEKWNFSSNMTKSRNDIYASPMISGGRVYIGSEDHNLYCLDSISGRLIWNFSLPFYVYSSVAINEDRVFVHGTDFTGNELGRIYALPKDDPNGDGIIDDSEVLWSFKTGDWDGGSSPAVADGKVLVGSTINKLFCLDDESGSELWNLTTGHYIVASPFVFNGIVYITSEDGTLYALGGEQPASLEIEIIPEQSNLKSNRVMGISFVVTYRGFPIEGAFINFEVDSGELSQTGASSWEDGSQRVKYTAPSVSKNTTITVSASAVKYGYPDGESTASFVIEPPSTYKDVKSSDTFSLARYWLYLVAIIALILINILIVVIGRKKGRIEGENSDEKDEGGDLP
jgi:outer membrane protein assembly factor BamB